LKESLMDPHIFRQYDIRGVVADALTPAVVTQIGRALGTMATRAGAKTFAVGRDCRTHSPLLRDALVEGLVSCGLEVIDVGLVPTPLLYFAVFHWDLGGGVQITGSHNPPAFNGLKMMLGKDTLYGDQIQALRAMIEAGDLDSAPGGAHAHRDALAPWLDHVAGDIRLGDRPLKVVIDAGNGVAGIAALPLLERLGLEVIPRFLEPDGTFPNHHPDPAELENLEDLIHQVHAHGADLGIAYDGDGDRIGVIDRDGEVIWGDRLMILLSRAVLAEAPGATIVGEVKCSQTLYDDIRARGGEAIMWKVGHSLIKRKMKETGALLAGEMSGHIFFKHRYFGFDDAVYTTARLIELLSHAEGSLGELLADVPTTWATPEIRLEVPDAIKFDVVARIVEEMRREGEVVDIDGVRVIFPDGWGLIRASNTQPALVLRAEAQGPERRDAIEALLRARVADACAALDPSGGA
jgi:phosphomannomutase/phosphoglucomutase